jgi:hypothetical protein
MNTNHYDINNMNDFRPEKRLKDSSQSVLRARISTARYHVQKFIFLRQWLETIPDFEERQEFRKTWRF